MEAQRYPNDFDGIIVGSPANDLAGLGASFLWNMQALLAGPQTQGVPDAYVPVNKITLLSKLAISKCVGKDGGDRPIRFSTIQRSAILIPRSRSVRPARIRIRA